MRGRVREVRDVREFFVLQSTSHRIEIREEEFERRRNLREREEEYRERERERERGRGREEVDG